MESPQAIVTLLSGVEYAAVASVVELRRALNPERRSEGEIAASTVVRYRDAREISILLASGKEGRVWVDPTEVADVRSA